MITTTLILMTGGGITPINWVLSTGYWNDSAYWDDSQFWKD